MGIKRYELSEAQWRRVAVLAPGKSHWCGWPDRYGKWKTVHRRFSRWCHVGVWKRLLDTLTADRDNQYLMIDSAVVRARRQAASGEGRAGTRRRDVPKGA